MEKKSSLVLSALSYGAGVGMLLIIFSLIMYILDMNFSRLNQWAPYILLIIGMAYSTKMYRDKVLGGTMNFGRGFLFGWLVAIVASLLSIVFGLIMMNVIDPGLMDRGLQVAEEKLLERGLNDEQIRMALDMQRKMMSGAVGYIIGFVMFAIIGAIISLITAAIYKKDENQV